LASGIIGRNQRVAGGGLGAQLVVLLQGGLLQLRRRDQVAHHREAPDLDAAVIFLGELCGGRHTGGNGQSTTEAMIQRRIPSSPFVQQAAAAGGAVAAAAMTFSLWRQLLSRRANPTREQ
jgi:hypothetical protein